MIQLYTGGKMKFFVIASGSKGNVSYIEHNENKILIDAGISYTKIKNSLELINVGTEEITHLFLTHEHSDHIAGLSMIKKKHDINIYTSKGTKEALKLPSSTHIISGFEPVILDGLSIIPIPLSHDAKEPFGFLIESDDSKICYITDTGYISHSHLDYLKNCDLYYLESNHDPYLLTQSKRPYPLIRRILNEKGHLSNEDSAYYFSKMMGENTKHLIIAHVSEECNTDEAITHTYKEVLAASGIDLNDLNFIIARQNKPLEVITL